MKNKRHLLTSFVLIVSLWMSGCGTNEKETGAGGPAVESPNAAPQILSAPIRFAQQNNLYEYKVEAVDPDGDPIAFSLLAGPIGMSIDPARGIISWLPQSRQGNTLNVQIVVTDGKQVAGQKYTLSIESEDVIIAGVIDSAGGSLEITNASSSFNGSKIGIAQGVFSSGTPVRLLNVRAPSNLPGGADAFGVQIDLGPSPSPPNKLSAATVAPPVELVVTYPGQTIPENHSLHYSPCPTRDIIKHYLIDGYSWCDIAEVPPDWVESYERLAGSYLIKLNKVIPDSRFAIIDKSASQLTQARELIFFKGDIDKFKEGTGRSLILIHGVLSSSNEFDDEDGVIEFFTNSSPYTNIIFYNYPSAESIRYNAYELFRVINNLNPKGSIDIIAHSMGGMVARYAIESRNASIRDRVRQLVMLATPNFGVRMDDIITWVGAPGESKEELTPGSDFLQEINLKNENISPTKNRGSVIYHLFLANTLHIVDCSGLGLATCRGHAGTVEDPLHDHFGKSHLARIDLVPVPVEEEQFNLLGLKTEPNSFLLFDGSGHTAGRKAMQYTHTSIHNECVINLVCGRILEVLRGGILKKCVNKREGGVTFR